MRTVWRGHWLALVVFSSACGASGNALTVVRAAADSLLVGNIDGVMANVGVPFESSQGRVETSDELRAALEYRSPEIANRGYQVLSVSQLDPATIPEGNAPWREHIASHPDQLPVLVVVRTPEGREIRYLTLVAVNGRSSRIVGLYD